MGITTPADDLRPEQFRVIRDRLYDVSGINMQDGKAGLVRTRLSKRVSALGLGSFRDYVRHVEQDATEFALMVDLLTTNKTSFFREARHFEFLREAVLPSLTADRPVRIWSAGCSTGEEPYTLVMLLREAWTDFARRDVRVLATDLSTRVLTRAAEGRYTESVLREVPPPLRSRYFERDGDDFRVRSSLRAPICFARLNLMEAWPMKGPFDAIFCRNVMIYFDRPTQERLINRFWKLLRPGGHLFVGHSESLTPLKHSFRYVEPAVYAR